MDTDMLEPKSMLIRQIVWRSFRGLSRAALLAALTVACYQPDFGKSAFRCSGSGECPAGYSCIAGCCGGGCPAPDAAPVMPDGVDACVHTLSGIGVDDFRIEFAILTQAQMVSAVLHQRATCDESRDFWDVQLVPSGAFNIALNEVGGPYTNFMTMASINDGRQHTVVIKRASLFLSVMIDGTFSGSAPAAQRLGTLPPLDASDPCSGRPQLVGISGVCLTRGQP